MRSINLPNSILIAFLALSVGLFIPRLGAGSASAGTQRSSGNIPGNALDELCSWQSLPPNSHVWYRIPQGNQKPTVAALLTYPRYIDGLRFQVYAARLTVAGKELDPWGAVGCSAKTSSRILLQWLGAPIDDEVYYVDVVNDNPFTADYALCNRVAAAGLLANW